MTIASQIVGIPSLAVTGIIGVSADYEAAGTTQATATPVGVTNNRITSVASGSGVRLAKVSRGDSMFVLNDAATDLLVYPPVGEGFEGLSVNAATTVAAGAYVEFKKFSIDTWARGADAAGTSFTPSGIGAIPRNLQAKNREIVSVTDFYANGASGVAVDPTGVVDSYLGIQAALDTGASVYIPDGTYLCSVGVTFSVIGQRLYGNAGKSVINYTGAAVGVSFAGFDHCRLENVRILAPSATKAVYVGSVAHCSTVTGCDIRGASNGTDGINGALGSVSSGTGIEIERSFFCNIANNDISYFAKGVYGFNECSGNFITTNTIRHCNRGVHISDLTGNSDGNSIAHNEINGGTAGNLYAIDIQGGSNHMVAHNRLEYATNGTAHIYVHEGAAAATRHSFTDNHCVGDRASVIFGDNSGANKVVNCQLKSGFYAVSVTIGVDCDHTVIDTESRSIAGGGVFTDNSVTTIKTFYNESTFSVGITGLTTTPTASFLYTISKNVVTVWTQILNGTSNSTACTLTGWPDLITPKSNAAVALVPIQDNGSAVLGTIHIATTGVVTLSTSLIGGTGASFTAANAKGILAVAFSYRLH